MNAIGWFGRPGREGTNVHVVNPEGKVLCGYKPHPTMQFQWSVWADRYWVKKYVECKRCKERALRQIDREEE